MQLLDARRADESFGPGTAHIIRDAAESRPRAERPRAGVDSQLELDLPLGDAFGAEGQADKQIHQDFYQNFDTTDLSETDLS